MMTFLHHHMSIADKLGKDFQKEYLQKKFCEAVNDFLLRAPISVYQYIWNVIKDRNFTSKDLPNLGYLFPCFLEYLALRNKYADWDKIRLVINKAFNQGKHSWHLINTSEAQRI